VDADVRRVKWTLPIFGSGRIHGGGGITYLIPRIGVAGNAKQRIGSDRIVWATGPCLGLTGHPVVQTTYCALTCDWKLITSLPIKAVNKMLAHQMLLVYNQTWIQDLLIHDQDQDSAVSRPRPRLISKTKSETQDLFVFLCTVHYIR